MNAINSGNGTVNLVDGSAGWSLDGQWVVLPDGSAEAWNASWMYDEAADPSDLTVAQVAKLMAIQSDRFALAA